MKTYALTVNGVQRRVEAGDPMTPLLWILRDRLGLTGTKYGCGVGICGACTVHVDGDDVRSCQVSLDAVASAAGRVTTIEGLSAHGGGRHPCQTAWLEEDVAQCGYCQTGMIMTAAALLRKNLQPTDADIDQALGDHVCRCGTYPRIRRAVHAAARAAAATPAAAGSGRR
jgi:aerobic-type carbon monoxide dehydrogenase small subunit (CoxS/CutS family)